MKYLFILLFISAGFISYSQNTNKPPVINIDSIKRVLAKEPVKYDTLIAMVTYTNKENQVQEDTCTMYLYAKKSYIFLNFGQFNEKSIVKFSKFKNDYVIYPNWAISKIVRLRNNKSLYKGRIIKFIKL